jgi:hypothetical protein
MDIIAGKNVVEFIIDDVSQYTLKNERKKEWEDILFFVPEWLDK